MTRFCHFLTATGDVVVDIAALAGLMASVGGLRRAEALIPAQARDLYYDDGAAPKLVLQLTYDRLEDLESAAEGPLSVLPDMVGGGFRHQAMVCRVFPTPDAGKGRGGCAYLVHYWGMPDNAHDWHRHYLTHHAPVMTRFPDVRGVEVYTPVEWVDGLDWPRDGYFQRNRILFDDAAALEQALHSPVREDMKADRARFPVFEGGSGHFAMQAVVLKEDGDAF